MTVYCLEMRSTQNWNDIRFRDYTASAKKAERFKRRVPRIDFTDSGHGIVPHISEGRRGPRISDLAEHVDAALKQEPKKPKGPSKNEQVSLLSSRGAAEGIGANRQPCIPLCQKRHCSWCL